ncbi:DUF1566 domain-containing protein [Leptospira andrefontaineae]|nr:DUF1566 domain-containing protein [Leptospira andrefontaineae]
MSSALVMRHVLLTICILLSIGCERKGTDWSILGLFVGNVNSSGIYRPVTNPFDPGDSVSLNGSLGGQTGSVVSVDGSNSTLGISTSGSNFPDIFFIFGSDGVPNSVDVNGDGVPDYYLCYRANGSYELMTAINCGGNSVKVIPGQGYDTNGDGIADNSILASVSSDSIPPASTISPSPSTYGSALSVTIACSDNVAPGNIVYTLNGNTPSLFPVEGTVSNPSRRSFLLGSGGDGTYTVKFKCRDLAGLEESIQTVNYIINHSVPDVTISSPNTYYISTKSNAISSSTFTWSSNQSGNYTIRKNASNCSSGTIVENGSVLAGVNKTFSVNANTLNLGSNSFYVCLVAAYTGFKSISITRDDTSPSTSASPGGGSYGANQNVSLSCTENSASQCLIAYSINAADPVIDVSNGTVTSGTAYSSSISIPTDTAVALKFIASDGAGNLSTLQTANYYINTSVANVTTNSFSPASLSVNSSANQSVTWVSDQDGIYSIKKGLNCTSGTSVGGTNSAGTVTAGNSVTSTILNSYLSDGANTIWICVANAVIEPQYGSTSFSVTKDSVLPTVSSVTPANLSTNYSPSTARISIQFSKSMNTSYSATATGSTYSNPCYPAPTSPTLSLYVYDGANWDCLDFKAKFTWTDSNNLQIDLSWIQFPENSKLTWTLSKSSVQDISGNPLAVDVQKTFSTGLGTQFFSPLKTGQTSCWDSNGNLNPCVSTYQDGLTQYGATRSYSINYNSGYIADAITVDSTTGLTWRTCPEGYKSSLDGSNNTSCVEIASSEVTTELSSCYGTDSNNSNKPLCSWAFYDFQNSNSLNHISAVNACSYLNSLHSNAGFAGITNWRLPNQKELETLVSYGSSSGFPSIVSSAFPNSLSDYFWSSTLRMSNQYYDWGVNFNYGSSDSFVRGNSYKVRCVSGSPSLSRSISSLGNGTVRDVSSGLVWQQCSAGLSSSSSACDTGSAVKYNWDNAMNYCANLTLASRSWRLPNITELNSLVDRSFSGAYAIDQSLFPNTKNSYYWTSTSYAPSPGNAWTVFFQNGNTTPFSAKTSVLGYVRCVATGP